MLSLLAKSNYAIPENTGVLVDGPVISDLTSLPTLHYIANSQSFNVTYTVVNADGTTTTKQVTHNSSPNGNG
jgi:hypothetical protein